MSIRDQMHVLVVDDMSTSRGLIVQALDTIGIAHIFNAAGAAEALALMAARPIHLVISDYNMPGMDGLALLRAIRTSTRTCKAGFILITGRVDSDVIDTGRTLGMNNYMAKPFTPAELKSCIEAVAGRL